MTWFALVPSALLIALLLFVPGYVYLRQLGVRGILAAGGAPAASVGAAGVGTIVLGAAGVRWALWSVLPWLVLVAMAIAVVRRFARGELAVAPRTGRRSLPAGWRWAVGAGLLTGFVLQAAAYARGMGGADAVTQMHDSLFHLNGVALVERTGNVSPLGGLAGMYGGSDGGFYPTAWHALVVLAAPLSTIPAATNAAVLVAVLGGWLLGLSALARVVAPARPSVAVVAPLLGGSFVVFPTVAVVFKGMYPFGLTVALTPGAVALAVAALQGVRRGRAAGVLGAALAACGVVLAHSSGAAALTVLLAPVLVGEGFRWARELWGRRRRFVGVVVGGAPWVALAALVTAVFTVPRLRGMAAFDSPEGSRVLALGQALLTERTGESSPWVNVVVAALVLVGVVAAATSQRSRWLAVSWLLMLGLFVVTAGPDGRLRTLAGFWYKSPDRVESLLVTLSAVVAALGAVTLARVVGRWVRSTWPRLAIVGRVDPVTAAALAAVVVLAYVTSGGFRTGERELWTERAYDPDEMIHPAWADEAELEFIAGLDEVLPADAVVLGDPMNGAAFLPALAGREAAIAVLGDSVPSADEDFLMEHFHDLDTDPRVCEALTGEGIEYFYEDASVPYGARTLADFRPGLYDVDTTTGLELLARDASAALYRITAC